MSSSFIYCACDECLEYTNKKYNSYPICDDCLEYDIYIENGGVTLTPVDLNNSKIFEFDETNFEIIDNNENKSNSESSIDNNENKSNSESSIDSKHKDYNDVAWLTGC